MPLRPGGKNRSPLHCRAEHRPGAGSEGIPRLFCSLAQDISSPQPVTQITKVSRSITKLRGRQSRGNGQRGASGSPGPRRYTLHRSCVPELGSHGSHAGRRSGPGCSDLHHAEMARCPAERRHPYAQVLAARSSQHGSAGMQNPLWATRKQEAMWHYVQLPSCRHTADKVSGRACPASNLAKASKSSGLQTRIVARLTQSFWKSWFEGARSVAPAVRQAQATAKPPTLPASRLQSTRVLGPSTCSRHEAAACSTSDAGRARSPSPQNSPSGNKWRESVPARRWSLRRRCRQQVPRPAASASSTGGRRSSHRHPRK